MALDRYIKFVDEQSSQYDGFDKARYGRDSNKTVNLVRTFEVEQNGGLSIIYNIISTVSIR